MQFKLLHQKLSPVYPNVFSGQISPFEMISSMLEIMFVVEHKGAQEMPSMFEIWPQTDGASESPVSSWTED